MLARLGVVMKRTLALATALTGACLLLAMATVLSSCAALGNLNIQNPRYSIRNIRPRVDIALPFSASAIDLGFTIGVDNPNSVGLRLDRVDFNLLINDQRILDSYSDQNVNIPKNGYGEIRLNTRIGYQQLQSGFRQIADLIQGNRAKYEIRGTAYYNTPVGQLKFPVSVFSTNR